MATTYTTTATPMGSTTTTATPNLPRECNYSDGTHSLTYGDLCNPCMVQMQGAAAEQAAWEAEWGE